MPCIDIGAEEDARNEREREKQFLEAALCATLHALGDKYLKLDFERAGISKEELKKWWRKHKRLDAMK
jgi:hypothetical protein